MDLKHFLNWLFWGHLSIARVSHNHGFGSVDHESLVKAFERLCAVIPQRHINIGLYIQFQGVRETLKSTYGSQINNSCCGN